MSNRYALVQVVDEQFTGNLMCFTSMQYYQKSCEDTDFFVITTEHNPFRYYYEKLGIELINIDEWYKMHLVNINSHQWSNFVYGRFMIFELELFKKYNMVVYADIDTVPVKKLDFSVFENLNGKIGMVPELDCQYVKSSKILFEICEKNNLKYTMGNKYCNAGMLYIPKKILSDNNVKSILINSLKYTDLFASNDQDIINCLLGDKIKYLDPIYNMHPGTLQHNDYQRIVKDVIVCHYAAITKYQKFKGMISKLFGISDDLLQKGI